MKSILAINIGSSSRKYSFFSQSEEILTSYYEKEEGKYLVSRIFKGEKISSNISEEDFLNSSSQEIEFLKSNGIKEEDISAVGFRVVCPGEYFLNSVSKIDEEYISVLEKSLEMAPLHLDNIIKEIKSFRSSYPKIPSFGVSDSALYKNLPLKETLYSIPLDLSKKWGIRRFGYHGLSVSSVLRKSPQDLKNIVVCHLGSGASVVALKDNQVVKVSMGFTPLEGLTMATRSGDIDFGALTYLAKSENFTFNDLNLLLNKKSGLLGLSGSNDMREIIKKKEEGDEKSILAFNIFVSKVRKYLGEALLELGKIDLIIFTGAMGERSDIVREAVLKDLDDLGIKIDEEKNKSVTLKSEEGFIQDSSFNQTKIAVFKSDEMGEIVKEILK